MNVIFRPEAVEDIVEAVACYEAHGLFCTGCCWALMTLLFILGVMNLLWVAGLTLLVCIEKLLPRPAVTIPVIGTSLILWGAYVLM